jgi:hypothetical protein
MAGAMIAMFAWAGAFGALRTAAMAADQVKQSTANAAQLNAKIRIRILRGKLLLKSSPRLRCDSTALLPQGSQKTSQVCRRRPQRRFVESPHFS